MFHCYECDAQIEGPVWKSRCVACVVKKLEANLNENEELRKHLAAAEAIDDPNGQLVYYGDHKLIVEKLEKRLAEAEAKLTETEKELFILASDVFLCGWGVNAGLLDKAKRIYDGLRGSEGE